MQKTDSRALEVFLLAVVVVLGGLPFLKGGFYIGKHEGDTIQMADIVLRMARGEWPHLDFMSPIGVLAMAPIALFARLGAGIGHAVFWAQALVALILLLPAAHVARSRIGGWTGWAYAGFVMVLCLALVHGQTEPSISISMHYNRWAWAIVYVALPLIVLEPRRKAAPALDGVIIGLGMAALVLIKVTYFVSIAPAVIIGLLARRWWRVVLWAAIAGLAVALLVTALAGPSYWLAYVHDLQTVAHSAIRPQPGEPLPVIAAGPAFMGATLVLFLSVVFLRQAGRMTEGMVVLFLAPGLIYIVFQNYGNDPQWLMMLAMLAFVLRPGQGVTNERGWDLRLVLGAAALVAFTLGFASAVNLAYSPIRHYSTETDKMKPLISGLPDEGDLFAKTNRTYGVLVSAAGDGDGTEFASYRSLADRREPSILNGEELPYCELQSGTVAWFETVDRDLEAAGYGGKRLMAADLLSAFWLFGNFPPVEGAAPWYYGELSGIGNADYVVVPMCPSSLLVRGDILKALKEAGYTLTEVHRTKSYILIEPRRAL